METSETQVPSLQEMFNRAWRGLKAQNWRKAMDEWNWPYAGIKRLDCSYLSPNGDRCAWGHVDPEGTIDSNGTPRAGDVTSLRHNGFGLASRLTRGEPGLDLAIALQNAHDSAQNDKDMESRMREVADQFLLDVPAV